LDIGLQDFLEPGLMDSGYWLDFFLFSEIQDIGLGVVFRACFFYSFRQDIWMVVIAYRLSTIQRCNSL